MEKKIVIFPEHSKMYIFCHLSILFFQTVTSYRLQSRYQRLSKHTVSMFMALYPENHKWHLHHQENFQFHFLSLLFFLNKRKRVRWTDQLLVTVCINVCVCVIANNLYVLPYCPACGELSDMKVSTTWLGNCSRIPRAIRPPCEYPENTNEVFRKI